MNAPKVVISRVKDGLQVWVSQPMLMQYCSSLSDSYLRVVRSWQKSGRITAWQYRQMNGTYYYEYTTIPDRKPAMYASMLPTRHDLIIMATEPQDDIKSDATLELEAKNYVSAHFKDFLHHFNGFCNGAQAINFAKACAMLEWILKYIDNTSMDLRPMDFFIKCCEIIRNLEIRYLPDTDHRRLKESFVKAVINGAEIYEVMPTGRFGNDYAQQHREDKEILSWIFELRANPKNYNNAFIIRKVQQECEKIGKPVPSDRWIGEVLERHETKYLTAEARYGSRGKYANPYKNSIPTANALFAGDCWEIDATRVNVIPHKDKNKKLQYLTIIVVRDVHSGCPLGMAFDVSENRWSVTQALSNAVANAGYLPCELRHDRFPGHNTEEVKSMLEALSFMGVRLTVTYKATGKQRLERWFGSMQTLALQNSPMYYGEGVLSHRKSAHRSREYMKEAKRQAEANGWDFDKAVNETIANINSWVNTPYSQWSRKYKHIELSPVQMHEQSEKPNVVECSEAQHAYLFGLKKTLQIRNGGLIHTTINKEDFIYQITDFDVIKRYGQVICCYDVEDLSKVHIYAPSNTPMKIYLGEAKEYVPVQLYGANPEYGRLAKVRALYDEFDRLKSEELQLKKAGNGESFEYSAEYSAVQPMTVVKSMQEVAESIVTNQHFGFDDDEVINVDLTKSL